MMREHINGTRDSTYIGEGMRMRGGCKKVVLVGNLILCFCLGLCLGLCRGGLSLGRLGGLGLMVSDGGSREPLRVHTACDR